jgi:hypothetical protein
MPTRWEEAEEDEEEEEEEDDIEEEDDDEGEEEDGEDGEEYAGKIDGGAERAGKKKKEAATGTRGPKWKLLED